MHSRRNILQDYKIDFNYLSVTSVAIFTKSENFDSGGKVWNVKNIISTFFGIAVGTFALWNVFVWNAFCEFSHVPMCSRKYDVLLW